MRSASAFRTYLRNAGPIRSVGDARSRIPNDLVLGMASAPLLCPVPNFLSAVWRYTKRVMPIRTVLLEGIPVEWASTSESAPVRRVCPYGL